MKRLSVIIPARDDASSVRACLSALAVQTFPRASMEVIVVDNASRNPAAIASALAAFPAAILVHESRPGTAFARNAGLAAARGEVIAFIDGDCLCDSTWTEQGMRTLASLPDRAILGGKVAWQQSASSLSADLDEILYFQQERYLHEERFLVTANMFFRRSVLESTGVFEESQCGSEDEEWCRRAAASGCMLTYDPQLVVTHPRASNMGRVWERMRRNARGKTDLYLNEHAVAPVAFARRGFRSFRGYSGCCMQRLRALNVSLLRKAALVSVWLALHAYAFVVISHQYIKHRLGLRGVSPA